MNKVLHSSVKHDYVTPAWLVARIKEVFGPIVTDPCTSDSNPVGASKHYTENTDGLSKPWNGLTYVNPPYGRSILAWVNKCDTEYWGYPHSGRSDKPEILLLLPSRTGTRWFDKARGSCGAAYFLLGRLTFVGAKDAAPFDSVLFYWGERPWLLSVLTKGNLWPFRNGLIPPEADLTNG
jgi:hypothetical protein